jgi:hypothetical protein
MDVLVLIHISSKGTHVSKISIQFQNVLFNQFILENGDVVHKKFISSIGSALPVCWIN